MTSELSTLFRQEIELAKTEARDEAKKAGKAGAMFGGAAVAGWLALLLLSLALAWLLDQAMNTALAFAIVGVLWASRPLIFLRSGRATLPGARSAEPQETDQGGRGMGQSAEELRREIEDTRATSADARRHRRPGQPWPHGRAPQEPRDERVAQRP